MTQVVVDSGRPMTRSDYYAQIDSMLEEIDRVIERIDATHAESVRIAAETDIIGQRIDRKLADLKAQVEEMQRARSK